jgi:hypothetical protein
MAIHPLTIFIAGVLVGFVIDEFFHFMISLVRGRND